MLTKFNKNCCGYHGETVAADPLIERCSGTVINLGYQTESLPVRDSVTLLTLKRLNPNAIKNIYISAGIHGDEPASVLALATLLEKDLLPKNANLWICPCLNPSGFSKCTRENDQGIDQNRDYSLVHAEETKAHIAWLEKAPRFDLAITLHEDWEANGFYLYEEIHEQKNSLAQSIIEHVQSIFPIDTSENIDGFKARGGIIQTSLNHFEICDKENPQCPEAMYLFKHKTGLSYTLETGSDFPLQKRVAALMAATLHACSLIVTD